MKPLMIRHLGKQPPSRQTFVSLRACRTAVRVAGDVLFRRRIDVERVHCEGCGEKVDCSQADGRATFECPHCSSKIVVPSYLRGNRKAEPDEVLPNARSTVERDPDDRYDPTVIVILVMVMVFAWVLLMLNS